MTKRSFSMFSRKVWTQQRFFKREAEHKEQDAWKGEKEFMASRLPYKRIDVKQVTKHLVTVRLRRYFYKADVTHKTVVDEEKPWYKENWIMQIFARNFQTRPIAGYSKVFADHTSKIQKAERCLIQSHRDSIFADLVRSPGKRISHVHTSSNWHPKFGNPHELALSMKAYSTSQMLHREKNRGHAFERTRKMRKPL